MRDYLGHAVINGIMQYASVSSVKVFDPRTKAGCPRRWWFAKIGGKKEVEKESGKVAKDKGLKLDAELKHFLATGEKNISALALKGLHILEAPGPDLRLDLALHKVDKYDQQQPDGSWKFGLVRITSALTAAGIPFVGELDVAHERGHYRDDDGEYHDDPPGTVEVIDIKFKTNAKDRDGNSTLFMPSDLVRDIQMAGYGEWVGRVRPDTSHVRLSHAYYPEKGALPTKVTKLHVLDDCRKTWEYVEGVVATMKDVARETDVEKVPGNTASCDAYAGCPHREYCSAYRRNSLDALFSKIATDFNSEGTLEALVPGQQGEGRAPAQGEFRLPVLRDGSRQAVVPAAAVQAVDPPVPGYGALSGQPLRDLPPAVPGAGSPGPALYRPLSRNEEGSWNTLPGLQPSTGERERQSDSASGRYPLPEGNLKMGLIANTQPQLMQQATTQQQLAQEEQQMRATVAQQQAQMPQQLNTAQLAEICTRLGSYGYGFPSLAGNAAQAYSVLGGQAVAPGFVYQGMMAPAGARRSLHGIQLTEVGHIFQLEGELAAERGTAQQAAQPMQPPPQQYVPQQPVVYAPVPVQPTQPAFTQQVAQAYNQQVAPQMSSILPPGAPESMPQLASPQTAPQVPVDPNQNAAQGSFIQNTPEPEKPKASRGRPKKAQDTAPEGVAAGVAPATPTQASAPATQAPPVSGSAFVQRNTVPVEEPGAEPTIVLINARAAGRSSKSLADYVDYINAELSKRYSVNDDGSPGIQDVRCTPKTSPLAFGGWKGAVREIVKSGAGLNGLEGTVLHLDTFMDELNEAVADALRVVAENRGWIYVRGVR